MFDKVLIGEKQMAVACVSAIVGGRVYLAKITNRKVEATIPMSSFKDHESASLRLSSTCSSSYEVKRFHFNVGDYIAVSETTGVAPYPLRNVGSHRLDINRQLAI